MQQDFDITMINTPKINQIYDGPYVFLYVTFQF